MPDRPDGEDPRGGLERSRTQQDHGTAWHSLSDEGEASVALVTFEIGGTLLSLPVEEVELIVENLTVIPIPGIVRPVLGAVYAQGRISTALDLRELLGLPGGSWGFEPEDWRPARAFLARTASDRLAFKVDGVFGVDEVPEDELLPVQSAKGTLARFARQEWERDGRTALVMDLAAVVATARVR